MANYTTDEVQNAVEKVIRSTVRHPTGLLGDRQVNTTFSDLQEAAAGVYILYFNAPFYTIYLGTTRLVDAVKTQESTLKSLIEAVRATDRLVEPIKDISPIANAKAALGELETAIAARSGGFADITKVPAFRRYAQSLNTFVQTTGGNVKQTEVGSDGEEVTSIVDTPSGARSKIPALVRALKDQNDELIRRAGLLAKAIEDFSSMSLPQVAAQGVVSRARQVLDDIYTDMASKDENARLDNLRDVTLDLLTQQPLVEQYGAARAPSEYITTKGTAVAYSDATHLATPAYVDSDHYGPYAIVSSNHMVSFAMDGAAPFNYPMVLSYIAELRGTVQEPFKVDAGVNDQFTIEFGNPDGLMQTYIVVLTAGASVSAQTLATDINNALGGIALRCEEVFYTLKYHSVVVVTSLGGNNARFTVMAGGLTGLGIAFGDEIDILTGADTGTTWTITALDPLGQYVDASGVAPITPNPDVEVQIGGANRILRLIDTAEATSVNMRRTVRIPGLGGISDTTAANLGWYPNASSRSRPVAAQDVASNIEKSMPSLSASTVFEATHYTGLAHADASNYALVTLARYSADVTVTAITGTTATMTAPTGTFAATEMSDWVVIRSIVNATYVNTSGRVVGIYTGGAEDSLQVVFPVAIPITDMSIEVGPDLHFNYGDVLVIKSGNNAGRYQIAESQGVSTTCGFEVILVNPLPVPITAGSPVSFNVEFGQEKVRFSSRLPATTSGIVVSNPIGEYGAFYFFTPAHVPAAGRGTTQYLQFTNFPTGASLNDQVLMYFTTFDTVSRQSTITGIEQGPKLLKITPGVESNFSLSFEMTALVPFGRIRVAKVADYAALQSQLNAWLLLAPQQTAYWRQLVALLSPLLTGTNPTTAQVNDARNHLNEMWQALTIAGSGATGESTVEYALVNYKAPPEEPVDTLLSTLRHKGADRGIDLLLEGQFSVFFGLDSDGVSYSGTLLSSLRTLAREDLPIRKTDRATKSQQKVIGTSAAQVDFEYNSDNVDPGLQPDIPAGADVPTPGANY